jgi:dihydrofolate synthase/folylpolyglutamate synthase
MTTFGGRFFLAIARPGVPLVIGSLPGEALEKVVEMAGERGAPLRILGRDFQVEDGLNISLAGVHQRWNAAVAGEIFARLGRADPRFDPDVFRGALSRVDWPGRFEIVSLGREFILDGAHNLEATEALAASLQTMNKRPGILLYGALEGKPVAEMLARLSGHVEQRVFVPPPIARAWAPGDYAGPGDRVVRTVAEGLALIDEISDENTTVLVTGSLFTVAEARRLLLKLPADPPVGL